MRLVSFMVSAARGTLTEGKAAYRIQLAPSVTAQVTGGFYTGPFPAAGSLPAGYQVRGTGDWLSVNPKVTTSGTSTTTETYYSLNGDKTSPHAYTKLVSRDASTILDLYTAPQEQAELPAFFAAKLSLQAPTVYQAEETFRVYEPSKSALGYRWAVYNGSALYAWIRAYQVSGSGASKLDKYEISADYRSVNGTVKPIVYAYGSYDEATRIGGELREERNLDTGVVSGTGAWVDVGGNRRVDYTQLVYPSGAVHKVMTYAYDPQTTLVTTEDFQPDGSGTGTISVNAVQRATTSWGADGNGTAVLSSGQVAYTSSRKGLALYPVTLGSGTATASINGSFLENVVLPWNGPMETISIDGSF